MSTVFRGTRQYGEPILCAACGEWFGSNSALEAHWAKQKDGTMRCLTPDEMEAKGMRARHAGFWRVSNAAKGQQ